MRTQDDAEQLLEPFKPVLFGAFTGAFSDWSSLLQRAPEETAGLTKFVRTRYLHDRVVNRLQREELRGSVPGLRVRQINGLQVAVLHDSLMLKFKKLDRNLRSRNIQTGQTVAFNNQVPLVTDGGGLLTNATGGYVLDRGAAELSKLVVVCWDGPSRLWRVDLDAGKADGVMVELPAQPYTPPTRRTRVRSGSEEKASGGVDQ